MTCPLCFTNIDINQPHLTARDCAEYHKNKATELVPIIQERDTLKKENAELKLLVEQKTNLLETLKQDVLRLRDQMKSEREGTR